MPLIPTHLRGLSHVPFRVVAGTVALILITACSLSTTSARGGVIPSVDPTDRSIGWYGILAQSEIGAAKVSTAYEAVRLLRPSYLTMWRRSAGLAAVAPVAIIDGGPPEAIDALRGIQADRIAEIRFVEPGDAAIRFGPQYVGGLIVVRLTAGGRPR
jgi:hypothetical protein